MGFTSNINQANLQQQTRALNEQQAQAAQRSSQVFAASESEKAREQQTSMYNLAAGDKFTEANPIQSFDEDQKAQFGDVTVVEYSRAQDEILAARKDISSGNTQKRIAGQMRLTKANNSLKKLAEDMMVIDQDTEEAANATNIGGPNDDLVKLIYKNGVEGTVKIVASTQATDRVEGDESKGRYIQYKDEEGNDKFISVDAYQKILKGLIPRQDVNGWVTKSKANIEADENYAGKSIEGKSEVIQAHIDDYLSDPKVLQALEYQYKVKGEAAVSEKLAILLGGSKNAKIYRKPDTGRNPLPKELDAEDAASQRHYDINQALQEDTNAALTWMNNNFTSRASKYGDFANKNIESVSLDGNNIVLHFKDGVRNLPYTDRQIHNLMNELVYTQEDERNISYSKMASSPAKNFGNFSTPASSTSKQGVRETGITNVYNAVKNDKGLISKDNMSTLVDNLIVEFGKLGLTDLEEDKKFWFIGEDKITFKGKDYLVTKNKQDVDNLIKDIDVYVKERKGAVKAPSQTATTTVQSR